MVVAFFGCAEEKHPFRAFMPIITSVFCMEIIVMVPLALSVGFFNFYGGVSLLVCYLTVFTGKQIYFRILSTNRVKIRKELTNASS